MGWRRRIAWIYTRCHPTESIAWFSGFKVVPYNIPDGSCAAYYPETNPLLPLSLHDPLSGTPSAKGIPVVLKPISISTDSPPLSS